MKASSSPGRRLRWRLLLLAAALGAVLTAGVGGWLTAASSVVGSEESRKFGWRRIGEVAGSALAHLSYDLPFLLRRPATLPRTCIVYLDERAATALGQRAGVWDRRLHSQLVRRMTADGARALFLDIVFADPSVDPAVDAEFAAALQENGRTFIGAALELDWGRGAVQQRTLPPTPVLRRAAAGWGLLAFRPVDADYGVRRLYCGTEDVPSAAWRAAQKLGATLPESPEARMARRWLNYYQPPDSFENISFDRALDPQGTPPGYFRDRFVFVGERSTLGVLSLGKDDFRTPFGVVGGPFAKGVEIHLTGFLNLWRGDWLTRLGKARELSTILIFGLLLGGGLPFLRPHFAALAALAAVGLVIGGLFWLLGERVWFAWCIPTLVQAPLALVWAVGTRYFIEERRRNSLREAFSRYLSPQMADRIADADFDLRPGGVLVQATVMFSDLENFTTLSEELRHPELVVQVLTSYFTHTTGHILESDGTILKYIGDSVQAVWGAPLPDRGHARKAAAAALRLYESSLIECEGRILRTRIGVHSGMVLAGNLGSAQRFDYAVTGDAVNLASRLEGLNKYFGTNIIVSDSMWELLGEEFVTRELGEFRVVGRKEPVRLHELIGEAATCAAPDWLEVFAQGLAAFRRGELEPAEECMRETMARRDGRDGPAELYLAEIAGLKRNGLPAGWSGVVAFAAK